LASVNPNETGLIDEAHGSLGNGLWKRNLARPDHARHPHAAQSARLAQLAGLELRLLESPASLPAGKQDGEPVLALRAGKLAAMGASDAARSCSRIAEPQMSGPCAGR